MARPSHMDGRLTQMTDAPDRIWAFYAPEVGDDNPGCTIVAGDACMHGAAPYVLTKMHDAVMAERDKMRDALKSVEDWWLEYGMYEMNGAPLCIFQVRSALAAKP